MDIRNDFSMLNRRWWAPITNPELTIDPETMTGEQVVAAYPTSTRSNALSDDQSVLAARPIFHRLRDSIEAHLTIVFAALAVSREAQARTCRVPESGHGL